MEYLGEFQTAFYYYPLIGAIVVVIEVLGIVYLCGEIGKVLSGRRHYFLPFFIGTLLYYLQINYQCLALNNLGILIQLGIFYRTITFRKTEYLWMSVFLFPGLYFLFGSFSVLFLILFSIYMVQQKFWLRLAGIWVLGGLFFFIGKEYLFFQTNKS